MSDFKTRLAALPAVDGLAALELLNGEQVVARLENQPGTAGSVRVYHALFQQYGAINAEAAQLGLEIYAEHTEDARNRPGAHPNIDRLFAIIAGELPALQVRLIAA